MNSSWVAMGASLLVWGLVFGYLTWLERRIRELEKR